MLVPLLPPLTALFPYPTLFRSGGVKVGGATVCEIVYVALVTLLLLIPLAAAIALSVVVVVTGTGPVYARDPVVGALPSVVQKMLAPLVVVLIVTVTEPAKVPPG